MAVKRKVSVVVTKEDEVPWEEMCRRVDILVKEAESQEDPPAKRSDSTKQRKYS